LCCVDLQHSVRLGAMQRVARSVCVSWDLWLSLVSVYDIADWLTCLWCSDCQFCCGRSFWFCYSCTSTGRLRRTCSCRHCLLDRRLSSHVLYSRPTSRWTSVINNHTMACAVHRVMRLGISLTLCRPTAQCAVGREAARRAVGLRELRPVVVIGQRSLSPFQYSNVGAVPGIFFLKMARKSVDVGVFWQLPRTDYIFWLLKILRG